jgi:hypothetical protein
LAIDRVLHTAAIEMHRLGLYIIKLPRMNRKQKQEPLPPAPKRQAKPLKGVVDDVYPFQIPAGERMSLEMRQYINELEREYIERYNILLNNRALYA